MFRDRHFDFYKMVFHDGGVSTGTIVSIIQADSPEDAFRKLRKDYPLARLKEVQPL